MSDDDPIMSAYTYAQRLGVREGFIPFWSMSMKVCGKT